MITWAFIILFVHAVHKIRIGPVQSPEMSVQFGPQNKKLLCEVKDETESYLSLAHQARWSLLLRQCKSIVKDKWHYLLCFGGRFERLFVRGHIRQELGVHDPKQDAYVNDYFVQKYVNGTQYNTTQTYTAEARCYCGEGEPKLKSVTMENDWHTLVSVEMFSCCQRVTIQSVIDSMPNVLNTPSEAGDDRFPGNTVQSVSIQFRNMTLVLDKNQETEKTFKLGEPKFLSRLPHLAIVPLAARPTLKPGVRSTLYFPIEGAIGGLYGLCHTFWNEVLADTYLDLIQAQIHPTEGKPEIYIIFQSLALCSLHQLLPRQTRNTIVQCGDEVETPSEKGDSPSRKVRTQGSNAGEVDAANKKDEL